VRLIDATPSAARRLAGDRPALGAGQIGELQVLRRASALVLGIEAVPDHHPDEMPAAWCRADPKTGEREVAGELLAHARRVRAPEPGLTLIGDKGFGLAQPRR
jgi:hypothetical protein